MLGDPNRPGVCNEITPNLWRHTRCGGGTFIDENGDVQCNCSGGQGSLFGCSFICGEREETVAKFNVMDALQGLSLAETSMFAALNDGSSYSADEED